MFLFVSYAKCDCQAKKAALLNAIKYFLAYDILRVIKYSQK